MYGRELKPGKTYTRLLVPAPFLPCLGVLETGKTLPSCPGYAQATQEFSVVSVTETAYLSLDRTGAETGNPEVTGTKPTHYLLLIGSGLSA